MTLRNSKAGRCAVAALVVLAALLAAGAVKAQPEPNVAESAAPPPLDRGGPPGGRGFGGGRRGGGRMFLVLRIAEALHLNDEQTIKVASSFRAVEDKRVKLNADKAALEAQLDGELAKKPIDDAKVAGLTQQIIALDRQVLLLPEEVYNSIQGMLTVEQRARLLLLRSHMLQQVQMERERRGLERPDGGDAGVPPSPLPGGPPRRGMRRFFSG